MQSTRHVPLLATAILAAACGENPEGHAASPPRAGGDTTIENRTANAYSFPAPNLTPEERDRHLDGDVAFEATFVTGEAPVNGGLGPLYNSPSCIRCHIRDGRGPATFDAGAFASPMLLRVSVPEGTPAFPGGPVPVPGIGTQIQDHAVWGEEPEAKITLAWIEEEGFYADGTPYTLRRPHIAIDPTAGYTIPEDMLVSPRIAPPVFGLGLLEAIPEETILALADPDDVDGDGISGRPNYVWDVVRETTRLGRFGWKSNTPTLLQQSAGAYADDMGVTSPLFPGDDEIPDINLELVETVTFYVQTLAVPARTAWTDPRVRAGEALFREIGCSKCHVETLETGDHPVPAVAYQTIHPYTDLLLHDMGPGLADGRPDYQATGAEWRTAPLWGIGLAQTILPQGTFLHDGRARTIEEAILWHGGEAEAAREAFRTMSRTEREALLRFLRSL